MKSGVEVLLPLQVRRSLVKFGEDLVVARKKRSLTIAMMCERLGIAKSTYLRAEKGDPTVSMGVYAMALFVLGFGAALAELIDVRTDEQGLALDVASLPKRVRRKKAFTGL
jgi:transcriptional regulator with XRE-family HTH domain